MASSSYKLSTTEATTRHAAPLRLIVGKELFTHETETVLNHSASRLFYSLFGQKLTQNITKWGAMKHVNQKQ